MSTGLGDLDPRLSGTTSTSWGEGSTVIGESSLCCDLPLVGGGSALTTGVAKRTFASEAAASTLPPEEAPSVKVESPEPDPTREGASKGLFSIFSVVGCKAHETVKRFTATITCMNV